MSWLAAAITGVANGINNIVNMNSQKKENQKNRDFQREMWNANNEYNTPKNQMARLQEAGINPHLAYANGQPMNVSNAPANTPNQEAPKMHMDFGAMLQALRTKAEIDNINADTAQKGAQTQGQLTLNGITSKDLDNYDTRFNLETAFKQSATSLNYSNIQFNDKKIEVSDVQIQETYQNIKNLITTNEKMNKEIDLLVTQNKLSTQQIHNLVVNMAVAKATIDNLNSQSLLNRENAKTQSYVRGKMEAETKNLQETFKMLNRGNYIGQKYDLSNAENNYKYNSQQYNNLIQEIYNKQKQNGLLDKQIDAQTFQNSMNYILAPAKIIDTYKNSLTPFESVTESYNGAGYQTGFSRTYRNK